MSNTIPTPGLKYTLCIVGSALIIFSFFQFVQKPKIIRQVCNQQALERSVYSAPESSVPDTDQRDIIQTGLQEKYYESCVVMNSVKP